MKLKKQNINRMFAIVITIALVLTLIPSVVFGGVNEENPLNTYNQEGSEVNYEEPAAKEGEDTKEAIAQDNANFSKDTDAPIENPVQNGEVGETSEFIPSELSEQSKDLKPQVTLDLNETLNQGDLEAALMAGEVAQIIRNGVAVNYNTLEAAFEDVQSDETIKMLTNYTYTR